MAAIRLFGTIFCHASRGMNAEATVTFIRERFGRLSHPSLPIEGKSRNTFRVRS